jgi:hypothetical protein
LHTVVPAWYYRKGYVQAVSQLIVQVSTIQLVASIADLRLIIDHLDTQEIKAIQFMGNTAQESVDVDVLFSAHGVPQSYILAGDPYQVLKPFRIHRMLLRLLIGKSIVDFQ